MKPERVDFCIGIFSSSLIKLALKWLSYGKAIFSSQIFTCTIYTSKKLNNTANIFFSTLACISHTKRIKTHSSWTLSRLLETTFTRLLPSTMYPMKMLISVLLPSISSVSSRHRMILRYLTSV